MAEEWAPALADVADYIPTRTIPTTGVGEQAPVGTFNETTTPNEAQAQGIVDRAVANVKARTGTVAPSLFDAAKEAAALRAAGLIELSYPDRDADVNTATALLNQSHEALDDLVSANIDAGGGTAGAGAQLLPLGSFPPPSPYRDSTDWI